MNLENLVTDDKEELLRFFKVTKNSLIRNRIALIFSDVNFSEAVPFIFEKIDDKSNNDKGTLVFALRNLISPEYFLLLIEIICKYEYEARLMAFGIIEDLVRSIPLEIKKKALEILEFNRIELEKTAIDKGEDSTLHFVENCIKLLEY